MRFELSILNNEAEMNSPTLQYQNAAHEIGAVRATIERDFSDLIEQQPRLLRLALNEAEALAWQSGFPELIFPILAQEKAVKVAIWHQRQQSVRQPRPLHAFAA
jgi:hypothetical protein